MLCLGLKKSLSSPRLKLKAQGMPQCTDDQSQVWYHSAIQAPHFSGKVGLNLALGLVTSCCSHKTVCWVPACCWLGWGSMSICEMYKLMVNEIFWEMYHLVYIFYFIKIIVCQEKNVLFAKCSPCNLVPVGPDTLNKVPYFSQMCQKSDYNSFYLKSDVCQNKPNKSINFCTTFVRKCLAKGF